VELKREQGCSEADASEAGGSTIGNVSQTTLSEPLNLDLHSPTNNIDDIPISRVLPI